MRTFEMWVEGTNLWGQQTLRARRLDDVKGTDFDDAVDKYVETLPDKQRACWEYCDDDRVWKWTGRRVFDNENEARLIYG